MLAQKKDGTQPAFASLTAGLLARKGEAHPAPAHLDGVSLHAKSADEFESEAKLERPATPPPVVPVPQPNSGSPRTMPQEDATSDGCCSWSLPGSALEPLPPGQRHSAGLRLDDERLRKVKILAARAGVSNQKVLLAALDHYLVHMAETMATECPCLARSMAASR